MLLNSNQIEVLHVLKVNGKVVFKNSNKTLVESYREYNLPSELKEQAIIEMVTDSGKQVLLG